MRLHVRFYRGPVTMLRCITYGTAPVHKMDIMVPKVIIMGSVKVTKLYRNNLNVMLIKKELLLSEKLCFYYSKQTEKAAQE